MTQSRMAPQVHNHHSQNRVVSLQKSIYLLLVLMYLHVCNSGSLFQVEAQKTTSFSASSGGGSSPSKTNEITSKFRENISQIQRKQVQQQVSSRISEAQEQQVIDRAQNQVQVQLQIQQPSRQSEQTSLVEQAHNDVSQQSQSEALYGSIKGSPGVEFPDYARIPNTKFSCDGAPFDPGMYADESTGCQVYHLCFQGRRESFLCGVGTVFNQAIMNCDFWHSVDCSRSSEYYKLNAEFGKSSWDPASSKKSFYQQGISSQVVEQPPSAPIIRNFQQQVGRRQESLIGLPQSQIQQQRQQSFIRVEENTDHSGKVSPAERQLLVSNFVSSQVQAGATKTIQSAVASSPGQYKQFSPQRNGSTAKFVSPGRRVAQLNDQRVQQRQQQQQQQNQFASAESSPAKSVSTDNSPAQIESPQQVGSSLIVSADPLSIPLKGFGSKTSNTKQTLNFLGQRGSAPVPEGESTLATSRKKVGQSLGKQAVVVSLQQPGGVGGEATTLSDSENEVWKPYFKSKSKTKGEGLASSLASASSQYPQPVGSKLTTTTPAAAAEESPSEESSPAPQLPPTVALPDKEPTFSFEKSSSPPTEPPPPPPPPPPPTANTSEDVSKVPEASTAPPQSSTEGATSEQTTTPSAIETDVGPAGIVMPEAAVVKDSPDDAAPPTTTTTTTTTTTESPPQASRSGAPPTTTTLTTQTPETSTLTASQEEEPKAGDVTTTTTTTTAAPTASAATSSTTVAPEESPSAGSAATTTTTSTTPAPEGELDLSEAEKKKRGVLAGGVEYAHDGQPSKRKAARAKSSAVEYANVPKAPK